MDWATNCANEDSCPRLNIVAVCGDRDQPSEQCVQNALQLHSAKTIGKAADECVATSRSAGAERGVYSCQPDMGGAGGICYCVL